MKGSSFYGLGNQSPAKNRAADPLAKEGEETTRTSPNLVTGGTNTMAKYASPAKGGYKSDSGTVDVSTQSQNEITDRNKKVINDAKNAKGDPNPYKPKGTYVEPNKEETTTTTPNESTKPEKRDVKVENKTLVKGVDY